MKYGMFYTDYLTIKGVYLIILIVSQMSIGTSKKGTSKIYSSSSPGVCLIPHCIVSYKNDDV